jgi:tetratricopeptide (TPR) repeat protein
MKTRNIVLIIVAVTMGVTAIGGGGLWLSWWTMKSQTANTPPVSVEQGFAFKHSGDVSNAIQTFEAIVRQQPENSDSIHGLAQARRDAGDLSSALTNHDRAIELDPERFDLYWERGITHKRMGNYAAAIADFEACLERNNVFANAHLGLAEAYREKGDFTNALQQHNEAIAMKPDSDWFYRERGNTYRQMNNTDLAEADFAKARDLKRKP